MDNMERREFLKLMGAGAFLATAACTRKPVEKIIPYVNKPEEVIPGVANWYASTCDGCSAACGMLVKTREGRPIKLEGNPEHPMSRGGLCARGQASLLGLYDPDRLKGPCINSRNGSNQTEIDWKTADEEIGNALRRVQQEGKEVVVLSGTLVSPSTQKLIQEFLAQFPKGRHVVYEGIAPEEIAIASEQTYGQRIIPRYRFDLAQMVLSFGADFLGTWLSPVAFTKQFAEARRPESGRMCRLACVASALSLTGTHADDYFSVKAGDEVFVALGLAHEIIVRKKQSRYALDSQIVSALVPYTVLQVASSTGIDAEKLQHLADELMSHRGEGLVLGGAVKTKNGVALQIVVNLLNSALGNEGITVDGSAAPSYQAESHHDALVSLIDRMQRGQVGALLVYRSNPVFQLPPSSGFVAALEKVSWVVSFSARLDETARASDVVCPDSHALESWNDANPQKGLYSLVQPAIAPMVQTRQFQESLMVWGDLPEKNWHRYLRRQWEKTVGGSWEESLQKGFVNKPGLPSGPRTFRAEVLKNLPHLEKQDATITLALYPSVAHFDGRMIHNVWLQELPDPISKVTWGNYLAVAPKTAEQLKLRQNDVVQIDNGSGVLVELPVHIQPKLHPQTVMAAIGYGQGDVGADVYPFQTIHNGFPSWSGLKVTLKKTGKRSPLAITQGHQTMEGRPIIQETTFAQFQKSALASPGEKPEALPSMWPEQEYKKHRWGMVIDLASCTGCNACMIGCQSENNIPVVGKEQVLIGREMHWIRLDRYYNGDEENPSVAYQPMLCQQCENAPCETVCPTLATFHNDEGLNMQTYNRCVGTRYCANNCPYKVRRFNYFDYSKQYASPLNLVLNPDITTRERGVMEKCTFCVQRIQEVKDRAKDEGGPALLEKGGRPLKDGEIKTACEQSCPANAIVFGDLNDPASRVAKLAKSGRGYHVLDDLNTKPQVTYLMKVRNSTL